ncbi:MAG: biosynthetic-type acetolactate synthase large subunit [Treponemataceae bacterium]|nr:biosynthetic-type acetolactate synthase large subunit [Treponemataceae bacterium]
MIEATGAQIIIKLLEQQNIKTVAGIPGGSVLPLYDELVRSSINHVLVRHEQAAGFLAQGMARTTGLPAVCIATSGPGAMNLLTAIADARSDSIPLVAITGQVNRSLIGTDAFQEADTFGLSFPITKHSILVKSAKDLLTAIPQAFAIASSGRCGPVLVDVPRDVQLEKITFESWPECGIKDNHSARFRTMGEDFANAVSESAKMLINSKKPAIYVGGGCNSKQASDGIKALQEIFPMPLVSSLMGIGSFPASSELNLGMVGMHGSMAANTAMHDADVILAMGVRFDDRATGVISKFCPNAKIIHVDIDAAEVNKIFQASVSVIGDVESYLPVLVCALKEMLQKQKEKTQERKTWAESLAKLHQTDKERINNPGRFISSIPELAKGAGLNPDDIIVTTDVGQHQMWTAQYYPIENPRQLLTSGCLGTMGFGLPAAIGAALANPDKRVICFSGDGSIMMNVQEMATLAEQNLDVTIIVLDNGALGMVRQQQEILFDKNYSASIYKKSPNLMKIAEGFGIEAVDVYSPNWNKVAFPPKGSGPRFVHCPIEMAELVLPFVPAGKANIEAICSME